MLRFLWQFRRFLRPYRLALLVGAAMVIGETLADLGQPWPLKVIIDGAIGQNAQHQFFARLIAGSSGSPRTILLRALIAVVILVSLSALFDFAGDFLMNSAGQRVMMDIRNKVFGHMQRLSLYYHDRQRVGDLVSRVTTDVDRLQDMLVATFDTLVPNGLMLVGLVIVMLLVDVKFGLLALTIAPPLFLVTYRYTLGIKRAVRRAREADALVASHASETLAAIRAVQAFSREDHESGRFALRNDESLGAGLVAVRLQAAFTPMVDMISLMGTLLVMYFGVRRVLDGSMSVGLLLVFTAYLKALYKPMRALSKLAYVVSRGTVSAERVVEVLQTDDRIPEKAGAKPAPRFSGTVEFQSVTFRHTAELAPVLRDVSFSVAAGERVGIVGRTGAGKSTLVSLISRFGDPEEGAVMIDGNDVRDFRLASLRRQVSYVLQEPVLFSGSILDNIRYGDPAAPDERVMEVVEAAHVQEFLDELPDGILTRLSERGSTLSGGQRQRIAIARAMLNDAPILILDEPTTGLDVESERLVLDGLARLSQGKTTFVISHHDSTLEGIDKILRVLDHSVIEESADRVQRTRSDDRSAPWQLRA
jgi:subfamily B ATP-binding cassette protein MsbA